MADRTKYEDPAFLNDYLARQLRKGSLAVILGAGASCGFGLPGWETLVDRMFAKSSATKPATLSPEMAAEQLLSTLAFF